MSDKSSIKLDTKAPGVESRPKPGQISIAKFAPAIRSAKIHPASPSLVAQALVSEGRLRSLEERKAVSSWHRPAR